MTNDGTDRQGGFTVSSGEPDGIDLELALLGAVSDPAAGARITRAAAGPLQPDAASIEAHRAYFEAHRPPLAVPPRSARRWGVVAGAVLALAAAALLAFLVGPGPADGIRAMGGLPVALSVHRDGAPSVAPSGPFRAGDELFVQLTAPSDGFVTVATVQADGGVSMLESDRPVRAGATYSLPGAARLDDTSGQEWLVVMFAETRSEGAADELRGLLPDPARHAGPRRFVLELTRGR